ncbi:MAG: orotidine-5'-phosphate decarboxylase [Buchnera aphidicola (Periphyllus lyropictus)]|uniref:orotidine-5'-phosphate decarboxylase n=1 Tax=Buchnera aphidicola TaxID=9 RepID=UPI001EB4363D|nr:orotidine-5'-phosphate decarboxylase [Buchnera aphidicola]NIH16609.1 orotidine-5'-phosphate decarboxylase [Buchnera aphidicola (Periphyllus lyropictus)]USS94522.1 orotidine-5'-phosphate decarboxylase [Buchnera aphidicola (Periphyllus lyropictus)]
MINNNLIKLNQTKIIIALDYSNKKKAMNLIKLLDPKIYRLKIGKEMFFLFGIRFIKEIIYLGFKIFLDLKLHDIPNTVSRAIKSLSKLNLWMISIHSLGGKDMMKAAKLAISYFKNKPPLLISITILSSLSKLDLKSIGMYDSINKNVLRLSKLSQKIGLDGVVCPGSSVKYIKKFLNNKFKIITPGIRKKNNSLNDQKNVITPIEAAYFKVNYIVLGRIITLSKDPIKSLKKISLSIKKKI